MPYPASCKPPVPFLARRSPRLWEASDSPPRPPRLAPQPPGFSMCRTGGFAVMIGTSRETGYPRGLRLTLPYVPQCGARSLKAEVLHRSACRLLVPGSAGMAPFTPTTCKSARPAQASASCFGSVASPLPPWHFHLDVSKAHGCQQAQRRLSAPLLLTPHSSDQQHRLRPRLQVPPEACSPFSPGAVSPAGHRLPVRS